MNKDIIKENLTLDDIHSIIFELGGEPEYTNFGLLCATICHNKPGEGSKKLYYYDNTKLFRCYTGCQETFDIFELVIKAKYIQNNENYSLLKAIYYIANKFGFVEDFEIKDEGIQDWKFIDTYSETKGLTATLEIPKLKIFNGNILKNFLYPIIDPWEQEHISREVIKKNLIGYYPPTDQITIPHFDIDGNLVGIRGRFLSKEDADRYGKYRPLFINKILYSHPLGYNLYNLNNSKKVIEKSKIAIVYEGEKSCLLHQTYFGEDLDFSVACCGSSISDAHIQLLTTCGAEEIVIAYDRQFQEIEDKEFQHLTKNLIKLYNKYKNYVKISIIFDKDKITPYKASPIDCGKEIFLQLFNNRITHL